jgi:hypothetical protein
MSKIVNFKIYIALLLALGNTITTSTKICPAVLELDRLCVLVVRVPGYISRGPG